MSRSLAAIRFFLLAQDSVWWRLGFFVPFVSGQKSAHSLLSGFAPYDGFAANCRCFLDTAESHLRFACLWNRRQLHGICHQLDLVSWTGYRQRMRDIGQFNAYKRTASNRILRWARRKLEKRTINHASRILVPDGFAANCRCFLDTAESHLRFACLWNRRQLHGICHQLDLVSWTGYRQRMRDIGQFNAYKRTASNRILRWARRKLEKRTINHASRILVPAGCAAVAPACAGDDSLHCGRLSTAGAAVSAGPVAAVCSKLAVLVATVALEDSGTSITSCISASLPRSSSSLNSFPVSILRTICEKLPKY
ncbi:uncharacterized protein LOC119185884 isoform X2 [Rhipicephalus microplus]|uniref:uncharacterized protein LOC119185884 isoform X2 n=1 Tax=Rhipicephalus microplus TaxID=6941 RepID=UPI003F6B912E